MPWVSASRVAGAVPPGVCQAGALVLSRVPFCIRRRPTLGGIDTPEPVSTFETLAIAFAVMVSPVLVLLNGAATGWQAGTISS